MRNNIFSDHPFLNERSKTTTNMIVDPSILNGNTSTTTSTLSGYKNYKQMLRNVKKGVTLHQRDKLIEFYSSTQPNTANKSMAMNSHSPANVVSLNSNKASSDALAKQAKGSIHAAHSQMNDLTTRSASKPNHRNTRSVSQSVLKKLKIKGAKIDVNLFGAGDQNSKTWAHVQAPPSTSLGYPMINDRRNNNLNASLSSINSDSANNPPMNNNNVYVSIQSRAKAVGPFNSAQTSEKSYPSTANNRQSSSNHYHMNRMSQINQMNPTPDLC